ncbi:MAG: type IV secretion system protein [Novosphingobium sp.]
MNATCDIARAQVGNGVAAALRGVDCVSVEMTQAAFSRLFGHGGALVPALTILLTLYVAFFAISLLTGRSRLGVSALTPRMMTLGLVLTFATSWIAYQSVVWNLATGAPDQIAGILTGTNGSATTVFADKIDIVFAAISDATSRQSETASAPAATFSPQNLVWLGAMLFLLGTVGVLVTARIALAVLVALGPAFVVLALFPGTRGLFTGWLKGVVMLALAPLFAVLGGTLMLELAVPVIAGIASPLGEIEPRAAMAFFLIGAVHVALMVLVMKTASTMVSGWTVFGLAGNTPQTATAVPARSSAAAPPAASAIATPSGPAPTHRPGAAAFATPSVVSAANDHTLGSGQRTIRLETRDSPTQTGLASGGTSRARGIGSRFRAAPVTRLSEKTS